MVKNEVGAKIEEGRGADIWFLKQLLQAHRDQEIQVFTSTLAIAECTSAGDLIKPNVKRAFERLLTSGEYVHLVQPTPFVMEAARDLRWVHGVVLRGADAVHVASAVDRKCEEFITTDGQIKKLAAKPILAKLGLKMIVARETGCLPEKYRQGMMDV